MAAKFHIKSNGEPGKCRALFGKCPLGGGEAEHFATADEAREGYEKSMQKQTLNGASVKKGASVAQSEPEDEFMDARGETYATQEAMEHHGSVDAYRSELYDRELPDALVASWADEEPRSLKYKIYTLYDVAQKGNWDRHSYQAALEQDLGGLEAGVERNFKDNTLKLLKRRHFEAINQEYKAVLEAAGVTNVDEGVELDRYYREEIYEKALEKDREELAFLQPLAMPYHLRWHRSKYKLRPDGTVAH